MKVFAMIGFVAVAFMPSLEVSAQPAARSWAAPPHELLQVRATRAEVYGYRPVRRVRVVRYYRPRVAAFEIEWEGYRWAAHPAYVW